MNVSKVGESSTPLQPALLEKSSTSYSSHTIQNPHQPSADNKYQKVGEKTLPSVFTSTPHNLLPSADNKYQKVGEETLPSMFTSTPQGLLSYAEQIKQNLKITETQNPEYICNQIPISYCKLLKNQQGQQECINFWQQCCGSQK